MTEEKKGIGRTKLGLTAVTVLAVVLTVSNLWVYADLSNQIKGLETDKSDLNIQVDTLQTEKGSLQTQVSDLQTDKSQLQSEIDYLEDDIIDLEQEISDLEWEIYLLEETQLHKVGVYWNDNHPLIGSPYVNIHGYIFNSGTYTADDVVYTVRIYDASDTLLKTEEIHLGYIWGKSYESFDVDITYSGDADYVTSTLDYW